MPDFYCEQCNVELTGDEVMCDSCGEAYLNETGPAIYIDDVQVSNTSQAYAHALETILGRLMR